MNIILVLNSADNPFIKEEYVPYVLKSNPHPFYSFIGLKIQMRIRIEFGLDSRSSAGFWKNDRAGGLSFFVEEGGKN
jgi:hypothetical protein